jgi:hypothetical protein
MDLGTHMTDQTALMPIEYIAQSILILRDQRVQLNADETEASRLQFATLKTRRGQHRKYLPFAFTEPGAIMATQPDR